MKNKKGFTLIELVMAIGLLGFFAITIGISLNRTFKAQKAREQKEYTEKVISSANLYVSNNAEILNDLSTVKGYVIIKASDLISNGYLSENTINPSTKERISKDTEIKVSYDANGTIKIDLNKFNKEDYLQALDIYVELGNDKIKDYCFNGLGTVNLSYVDSEGNLNHDYIKTKDSNGNYENITCSSEKIDTAVAGTYRLTYNYKLKTGDIWKRATRKVIVVDNVPPICVITGNRTADAAWRRDGLSDFNVGCKDAGGCLKVNQPSSPLINIGTKDVTISDRSGNKTTCTLYVYSDQISPTCSQVSAPSTWTNQNRTLTVKCTDSLSGCKENTITKTISTSTKETTATTTDNAVNTKTCTLKALVDKSAPTTTLKASATTSTSSITFTGKAQDTLSGLVAYQFSTNSSITASSSGWTSITSTTASKTFTKTHSTIGSSTWYFYTKDAAGNVGKSSAITITIENPIPQKPTLNISNPYQTISGGTVRAEIKWTAGQKVNAYCVIPSNQSSSSCTWESVGTDVSEAVKYITLTGSPGTYNYVAYVKNTLNKISPVSAASFGQIMNTTPYTPQFSITNPRSTLSGGVVSSSLSWTQNQWAPIKYYCILKSGLDKSACVWNSVPETMTALNYNITLTGDPGNYYYVAYTKNSLGQDSAVSNSDYGTINPPTPNQPLIYISTTEANLYEGFSITSYLNGNDSLTQYCMIEDTNYNNIVARTADSCSWLSIPSTTLTFSYQKTVKGVYYFKLWVRNKWGVVSAASNIAEITITNKFSANYNPGVVDQGSGNWYIKFYNTTSIIFNKPVVVDIFMIGGGQGGSSGKYIGGYGSDFYGTWRYIEGLTCEGGSGGKGGDIYIIKQQKLDAGVTYTIEIGTGGAGGPYIEDDRSNSTQAQIGGVTGSYGGATKLYGNLIFSTNQYESQTGVDGSRAYRKSGASGGVGASVTGLNQPSRLSTGGGNGSLSFDDYSIDGYLYGAGGAGAPCVDENYVYSTTYGDTSKDGGTHGGGHAGQVIYTNPGTQATGGSSASNNFGAGGGGGATDRWNYALKTYAGGNGSSGILIIRNAR